MRVRARVRGDRREANLRKARAMRGHEHSGRLGFGLVSKRTHDARPRAQRPIILGFGLGPKRAHDARPRAQRRAIARGVLRLFGKARAV